MCTYPMFVITKLTVMLSCTAHMLNLRESGRERRGRGRSALMGTSMVPSEVSISICSLRGLYILCVVGLRRGGDEWGGRRRRNVVLRL